MQVERVEELLGLIPSNAPYVRSMPKHIFEQYGAPSEVDIYAYAKNDPSFGWMFVKSFIDTGRPMPANVNEPELLRTYCYVRYRCPDIAVREALGLEHEANWQRRALLRCLLIMPDQPVTKIAHQLDLDPVTICIYGELFWNVRDRIQDEVYVNTLVYPKSRQVELTSGYAVNESATAIALRAGRQHGLSAVREWMGMQNPTTEFGAENHAKAYESSILSTGSYLARLGFIHQHDLAGLSNARGVLQSIKMGGDQQKDDDARRGVSGMSVSTAVYESFMKIMKPDLDLRLELQKGMANEKLAMPPTQQPPK